MLPSSFLRTLKACRIILRPFRADGVAELSVALGLKPPGFMPLPLQGKKEQI